MARHTAYVGALVIASSGSASNTLTMPVGKMTTSLTFVSPAAYTGTITVEGALGGETPQALIVDNDPVVLTAVKTEKWNIGGVVALALASSGTEAAERTVQVYAEFDL